LFHPLFILAPLQQQQNQKKKEKKKEEMLFYPIQIKAIIFSLKNVSTSANSPPSQVIS